MAVVRQSATREAMTEIRISSRSDAGCLPEGAPGPYRARYNARRMLAFALPSDNDSLKIFLLLIIAGVFVVMARWASRSTSSSSTPQETSKLQEPPRQKAGPFTWGPSAEEVAASFPADPLLGKIRMRQFYFAKTEARPGPADPAVFAEELFVEWYDPDTGYSWLQSYFVATPKGLEQVLKEK